jgi:hypothetical protein
MESLSLPVRLLILSLIDFFLNLPFGLWRVRTRKFSIRWFMAIHLPIPVLFLIRTWLDLSVWYIPISVVCAVAGQLIGGKLRGVATQDRRGDQKSSDR